MKKSIALPFAAFVALATAVLAIAAPAVDNAQRPCTSGVGTWWHWMNGHITREGITKDLEAMKRAGIDNATIFNAFRPESISTT